MAVRQRKPLVVPEDSTHPLFDKPVFKQFAKFDVYAKTSSEVQKKTAIGGIVSVMAIMFISSLVLIEVYHYWLGTEAFHDQLSVDVGVSGKVPVNFDITFPAMQCQDLSMDFLDATGAHESNIQTNIYRSPVDAHGNLVFQGSYDYVPKYNEKTGEKVPMDPKSDPASSHFCGKCYIEPKHASWIGLDKKGGAIDRHITGQHSDVCCNSCDAVMKMYDKHRLPRPHVEEVEQCLHDMFLKNPGCNLRGVLYIQKVKGNFGITGAPELNEVLLNGIKIGGIGGAAIGFDSRRFNASHIIEHLSFGHHDVTRINKRGVVYPLDGKAVTITQGGMQTVNYYVKVVPTAYQYGSRAVESSYEFAVSYHTKQHHEARLVMQPGIFFVYDFHPIKILHKYKRMPMSHFLVKISGLIGGLFVVTGMLDAILAAGVAVQKHVRPQSSELY